jgi:hypothetical protein
MRHADRIRRSAIADPATGVAVYDTAGFSGWGVFGGTSAATPIIAAAYALAGPPASASYPAAYPYARSSSLNDVMSGTNSVNGCSVTYLYTAGSGYDGPTGLGTPNGVAAFASGPYGVLSGTITDIATGKPVGGAQVTLCSFVV